MVRTQWSLDQSALCLTHLWLMKIDLIAQPPRLSSLFSKPAVLHLAVVPAPFQAQLIDRPTLQVGVGIARWDGGEQLATGIETLGQVALDNENVFKVQTPPLLVLVLFADVAAKLTPRAQKGRFGRPLNPNFLDYKILVFLIQRLIHLLLFS